MTSAKNEKKEKALHSLNKAHQILEKARSIGISPDDSIFREALTLFDIKNYDETIKYCEKFFRNINSLINDAEKITEKMRNKQKKDAFESLDKAHRLIEKAKSYNLCLDESLLLEALKLFDIKNYLKTIEVCEILNLELNSLLEKENKRIETLARQKEDALRAVTNAHQLMDKTKSYGLNPENGFFLEAHRCFDIKNYNEAIQKCKDFTKQIKELIDSSRPNISISISEKKLKPNTGRKIPSSLKNSGNMIAKNIKLKFSEKYAFVEGYSEVERLYPGTSQSVELYVKPNTEGEFPIEISMSYKDLIDRDFNGEEKIWINESEKQSNTSYLSLDRTIFEPVKQDFIISSQRPLPNVKNWIEKNDSSMYWFIICINNNSDKSIDEWGIELETPTTLKILDARIEGTEHAFNMKESVSKAWLTNWILGFPHHLGVVIPRKGSKRVYFKLGSYACGVSYSIKGKVSTSDCEIPIKEKHFKYSCDTATLKVAIRTNPEEAEKYAETVLSNSYNKDTALKLLHSFRIVQEIDTCCAHGNYGEIKDKLQLLLGALEGAKAGERLIRMTRDNLESVSIMGEADASAQRAGRLCGNLVDAWINEVLRM